MIHKKSIAIDSDGSEVEARISGFLKSNATVETSRSTTSQKYISLNETELIINDLLILAMKDYIKETKNQLSIYMSDYLSI